MRKPLFFALGIAAVAVAGLTYIYSSSDVRQSNGLEGTALLPGLSEGFNRIVAISIANEEGRVRLEKEDARWRLAGLDDVPIKAAAVRGFVLKLAQARIKELRTDNPDYFKALALDDTGTLVSLEFGDTSQAIIIGKEARSLGRFARGQNDMQAFVVKDLPKVPGGIKGWTDLTVPVARKELVKRVDVMRADGDYTVKVTEDGHILQGLKETETLAYETVLDTVMAGAVFIDYETIVASDRIDWSAAQSSVFSGPDDADTLQYTIADDGEAIWLKVDPKGVFTPKATAFPWSDYAFEISDYRRDTLIKPRRELIKTLEDDGADGL